MSRVPTLLILWLGLLLPFAASAAERLSPDAYISVLTCDTGNELYSLFGHTAIRVSDPRLGIDTVYNFGAFDFSTPNFYLKFVKGDLQYFVTTASYGEFLYEYRYLGRSVYEQLLNLSPSQKQFVFDRLEQVLGSNERYYTYKFIDRNCTTMVADILVSAVGNPLSLDINGKGETNRKILYGYLQQQFYANLGISIMFGAKTDRELYKVYLPMQLMESLSKSKNGSIPLSRPAVTVYEAPQTKAVGSWWDNVYTYAGLLLLLAFVRNRTVLLTWWTVGALLGTFLALVGLYSYHAEVAWNYNALLFSPFFAGLVVSLLLGNKKHIRLWWYACAACQVVYLFYMLNKPHLLLLAPIILVNALYLFRVYKSDVYCPR